MRPWFWSKPLSCFDVESLEQSLPAREAALFRLFSLWRSQTKAESFISCECVIAVQRPYCTAVDATSGPRHIGLSVSFSCCLSLSLSVPFNSSSLFSLSLSLSVLCVRLLCGCWKQILLPGSRLNWEQNTNAVLQWLQETFVLLKWRERVR